MNDILHYKPIHLTDEQQYVIDRVMKSENLFITGESGTGKSELIKMISNKLMATGDQVAITSANVNGAIHIGGKSIQSFSGLGRLEDSWEIIRKKSQLGYVQKIWNEVNVVIIDDINLLSPMDFKKILYVSQHARQVRTSGIQWILVGDFLSQIHSSKIKSTDCEDCTDSEDNQIEFCFQLPEWNKLIQETIVLTKNFRQEDSEWISILNDIRRGAGNKISWVSKIQKQLNIMFPPETPYTKLYPKMEMVNAENDLQYKRLPTTEEYKFIAQKGYLIGDKVCPLHVPKTHQHLNKEVLQLLQTASINEFQRNKLLQFLERNAVVEPIVSLKKGAFVILMATLHIESKLVKGAQGIVTGFTEDLYHYPIVKFKTCECVVKSYMWTVHYTSVTKMWYSQIPLRLGWAYNLYRLRGLSLDQVEINMRDMFEYGQVYEVFSKITSLQGINFTTINWTSIRTHPTCLAHYSQIRPITNSSVSSREEEEEEELILKPSHEMDPLWHSLTESSKKRKISNI
jgi:energy-coupling factor transporter ATP-binding protein EcfA2